MACDKCYECNCNDGRQYCQDCLPDEGTWLVNKAEKPEPFYADKNHAYIDPKNSVWILSHDRSEMIKLNGSGGENQGKTYKAGTGISIVGDTISSTVQDTDTITTVSAGEGVLVSKNANNYSVSLDKSKVPSNERLANVEKQIGELKAPSGTATIKVLGKDGITATQLPTKDFEVGLDKATQDKLKKTDNIKVDTMRNYLQATSGEGWWGDRSFNPYNGNNYRVREDTPFAGYQSLQNLGLESFSFFPVNTPTLI